MGEKFNVGSFYYLEFEIKKKNKYGIYYTGVMGHYEVIAEDSKNIEITDEELKMEGRSIIVTRRRIKEFKAVENYYLKSVK